MFIFGQDKNSMSLPQQHAALIPQGWLRALLLLVAYLGISVTAGFFIPSMDAWLTFSFILSFVLVYLFRKYVDKKSFDSIGLNFSGLFPDSVIGLSLGIFLVTSGTLVIFFLNGIEWIDIVSGMQDIFYNLFLLMMVAISEELVFRGYVLRNLMRSFNKWVALLISALLFTAVHLSNPDVPVLALVNTFLAGLVTGITFMNTRNLWLPIFFHFSWNFLQGPVLGYSVSGFKFRSILIMEAKGDELISGGAYGFEGSMICTIMLMIAVVLWGLKEGNIKIKT
jgi:membrane protease YdiL (CAAX protease family)